MFGYKIGICRVRLQKRMKIFIEEQNLNLFHFSPSAGNSELKFYRRGEGFFDGDATKDNGILGLF